MKALISAILATFLFSLISCSSSNIGHQYEYIEPNTCISNNIGYLKVFTDKCKEKGVYGEDPIYEVYKGYSIYKKNGDFLTDVKKSFQNPQLVRLEEGEYVVVAELHKDAVQSFIVSIKKGQTLEVDKSMVRNPLAMK